MLQRPIWETTIMYTHSFIRFRNRNESKLLGGSCKVTYFIIVYIDRSHDPICLMSLTIPLSWMGCITVPNTSHRILYMAVYPRDRIFIYWNDDWNFFLICFVYSLIIHLCFVCLFVFFFRKKYYTIRYHNLIKFETTYNYSGSNYKID